MSFREVPSNEKFVWENCSEDEVIDYLDPRSTLLIPPYLNMPCAHWKYIGRQRLQPIFKRFRTIDANINIKLLEERLYEIAIEFIFENYGLANSLVKEDDPLYDPGLQKKCRETLISFFDEGHTLVAYDLTHQTILGVLIARIHKTGFQTKNPVPNITKKTRHPDSWKKYQQEKEECTRCSSHGQLAEVNSAPGEKNVPGTKKQKFSHNERKDNTSNAKTSLDGRKAKRRPMRGNVTHNVRNRNKSYNCVLKEDMFDTFKKSSEIASNTMITVQGNSEIFPLQNNGSTNEIAYSDVSESSLLQKDGRQIDKVDIRNHRHLLIKNNKLKGNVLSFDGKNNAFVRDIENENMETRQEISKKDGKFKPNDLSSDKLKGTTAEQNKGLINAIGNNNNNVPGSNMTENAAKYTPVKPRRSIHNPIESKGNSQREHPQRYTWDKYDTNNTKENSRMHGFESFIMDEIGHLFEHINDKSILAGKECSEAKRSKLLYDLNIKKYYYIHLLCGKYDLNISETLLLELIKGLIAWAKYIMPAENLDAIIAAPRLETNSWLFKNAGFKKISQTEKSVILEDEDRNTCYEETTFVSGVDDDYCCYIRPINQITKAYWDYLGKY